MTRLPKWGGRRARAWTAAVLATYGYRCHLRLPGCTVVATTGDHIKPRSKRPDLQYDVTNGRPACLSCNKRRSTTPLDQLVVTAVDDRAFFESAAPTRTDIRPGLPPGAPEKRDGARP